MSVSDSFMIEVNGAGVGIVVRHRRGFRFYASDRNFAALECCLFRRPADAERSAALLMRALREAREAGPPPMDRTVFPVCGADRRARVDFGEEHLGRTFANSQS